MTSISPIPFGITPDGRSVRLYRLANAHGMTADVTDLGGCLVALRVPDGHGLFYDVVLGYDGAFGYADNDANFGAPVGRHANRIGGAEFTLNGTHYELFATEKGNSLHSRPDMWQRRTWEVISAEQCADSARLELRLMSPDGDQGFPGNLEMHVTYELTSDDALAITYAGTPDAPTIINPTCHSYFNLNGHASGTALHHTLQIDADEYTESSEDLVPTGRLLSVEDTPVDFRTPRELTAAAETGFPSIALAHGYDHNFVLHEAERTALDEGCIGALRRVATLAGDETGISMDVFTDTPGLQIYTANYIGGIRGKGGATYHDYDAVCLETQFFPDAIHHKNFAQPIFGPDRPYKSRTTFAFRHA